ncbi:MAG: NAD(P)/FAD-dependent oxidoreductase [Deltaproteobacteria bacterium]|nr:NAD(P)/FAD-dependent oxidoreductase [Deltaproteobacteria bacterium]
MERFDAIVVGAGNGGLTAAAGLAQKGLKVLLLERHNIPGGCATSFCRGRFEFEVALHQLSGMGSPEKPGPLRMGVLDHVEPIEMTDLYSVLMPDGFRLALKAEKEATVLLLRERFPAERDAVEKFFDLCYRFANELISAFYFKDPDTSRNKYPGSPPEGRALRLLGLYRAAPHPHVLCLPGASLFHIHGVQALPLQGRVTGPVQRPDSQVPLQWGDGSLQLRRGKDTGARRQGARRAHGARGSV